MPMATFLTHVKPAKDLECIPNGIAESEAALVQYEAAGGEAAGGRIRKPDLLPPLVGFSQIPVGDVQTRKEVIKRSAM